MADRHLERLASCTILSRPHPLAFARAWEMPDGEQRRRSGHHRVFLEPDAGANILADNANWLRTRLTTNGVPAVANEAHLSLIGNPQAMEAALAWYRAREFVRAAVGPTRVPTLFIWGDQDDTVGRSAPIRAGLFEDANRATPHSVGGPLGDPMTARDSAARATISSATG
jgi:pimeloyl-ACP methyl ester carboxylesterase